MLGALVRQAVKMAVVAGGAAAATAGARYMGSKRINAAERLGQALVDVERLTDAAQFANAETEAALAACAVYLINVAHESAAGISGPPALDPVGYERTVTASDGRATATITTTAHEPEARWQFEVNVPGVVSVNGSRRLAASRFSGPRVRMSTPDTVGIRFESGYAARIESDLEFASNLLQVVGPRTQLYGSAHLSDNRGNVGRIEIGQDGVISGTITRGPNIVGRFEGSLAGGLTFSQYPAVEQ